MRWIRGFFVTGRAWVAWAMGLIAILSPLDRSHGNAIETLGGPASAHRAPFINGPHAPHVAWLPPSGDSGSSASESVFSSDDLHLGDPLSPQVLDGGVQPGPHLRRWLRDTARNARDDHEHYYSAHTVRDLALGVAFAAPLANTSLDQDVRDWWQDDVRNADSDRAAAFWKVFGEGAIFVPAMAGLSLVGKAMEDRPMFDFAGDLGDRTTRAYLVGAPPMLFMQFLLGASRPGETPHNSRWKPFDDWNSVSGHAFIGAVPFITATHMTDNRAAQTLLLLGSTGTAWSRVNDDAHYLSQAMLGWYMAYLATRSVHGPDYDAEPWTLVPLTGPELSGLGLVWQR